MSDDKKNKNAAGGVTAAALIIALGVLFSRGFGLFPGNGSGLMPGDGTQKEESGSAQKEQSGEETQAGQEEKEDGEIPSTIVVSIKEDQVTINGHAVENEDELRRYVEEYNTDARTFVLEEDQSILGTYNWVRDVFDALDIELKDS